MADTPDVNAVETEDDYIHVRFRDPDRYDEIRTPDWAENPAESVSEGSEVRTGKVEGEDDWEVTSVLIKKSVGEDKARSRPARSSRRSSPEPRGGGLRSADDRRSVRLRTPGLLG